MLHVFPCNFFKSENEENSAHVKDKANIWFWNFISIGSSTLIMVTKTSTNNTHLMVVNTESYFSDWKPTTYKGE